METYVDQQSELNIYNRQIWIRILALPGTHWP